MPRVAIVGNGTAGPAAALNLVRRLGASWKIDIFDKAQTPRAVGAGIGIQPIGLTALKKLGLLQTVLKHGARIDGINTTTAEGKQVLDVSYDRYDPRLFGIGLHRGVLFESLLEACHKHESISQIFGVDINEIDQTEKAVKLRDSKGNSHGAYDLVIVANGSNSNLRNSLKIPGFFHRYAYGALFALLPDQAKTFGNQLVQKHDGPGCHTTLGFLPTGSPWFSQGQPDPGFTTTLYYNMRVDEWQDGTLFASNNGQAFLDWKDKCSKLMPISADLIHSIQQDQIAFASYGDGGLWRFNAGRVVVLGDCAHSMSPQLGQGCNLALIDAEKLVDCLEKNGVGEKGRSEAEQLAAIPSILEQYSQLRWSHVQFYAAQSRILTPLFASKSILLRLFRDVGLARLCRTPIIRDYVHGVLCGAQSINPFQTIPEEEWLGFLEKHGPDDHQIADK